MKLALISDIHSNLYAFESVLKDINQRGIDQIYCLGDSIGYHSFPNEVIDRIRSESIISIKGNHDRDISDKLFDSTYEPDYIKKWTYDQLRPDNLEYIQGLEESLEVFAADKTIRLVHGSLFQIDEYLHENSPAAETSINAFKGSILVCAHTHLPYFRLYGNKLLINTGSVGKPKIGRPNATYITMELEDKMAPMIGIQELVYDFEKAAVDMEKKKLPQKFADSIRSGKA